MLDQALDAAERLGELEELRAGDELDGLLARTAARNETIPPKSRICVRATAWPGCAGEPGVEHALDRRVGVEELGDRRAFSQCWRIRSASVFMPRRTSQPSNGPGTAPSDFCRK